MSLLILNNFFQVHKYENKLNFYSESILSIQLNTRNKLSCFQDKTADVDTQLTKSVYQRQIIPRCVLA